MIQHRKSVHSFPVCAMQALFILKRSVIMEIKSKHVLHMEFQQLNRHIHSKGHITLIICCRSMPLLRRNGGSFPELTVPQLAILTPFQISYSHMSYRHNLYHLTHVTTKHAVQMRHFHNVQWRFTRNPFPRENLPMKFGFCRPSHMIFLQCVSLTHSSNSQTINHYLIIQSKLIVP